MTFKGCDSNIVINISNFKKVDTNETTTYVLNSLYSRMLEHIVYCQVVVSFVATF